MRDPVLAIPYNDNRFLTRLNFSDDELFQLFSLGYQLMELVVLGRMYGIASPKFLECSKKCKITDFADIFENLCMLDSDESIEWSILTKISDNKLTRLMIGSYCLLYSAIYCLQKPFGKEVSNFTLIFLGSSRGDFFWYLQRILQAKYNYSYHADMLKIKKIDNNLSLSEFDFLEAMAVEDFSENEKIKHLIPTIEVTIRSIKTMYHLWRNIKKDNLSLEEVDRLLNE
ncbi:hypothetical protein EHQ68_11085 [Leptospira congkakensis]|uniref:Uncharacterized protein n=1 Tax=Leptospira congkakensis TaxID=2484932 RepID=A0A4Z1A9V6_9LEPT|nr:hypothetical protein [Leptospira congkakensis]TGL88356.1 hypothetical protein EHQ68_11085 [Leptospira congkakensis]TGL95461.1 hypothetical protein EHQ69_03270 [Leptospira congkakensis]TGL96543.1 hypothetical protein EHQ70_10320 [Leptospira congkakensis]